MITCQYTQGVKIAFLQRCRKPLALLQPFNGVIFKPLMPTALLNSLLSLDIRNDEACIEFLNSSAYQVY